MIQNSGEWKSKARQKFWIEKRTIFTQNTFKLEMDIEGAALKIISEL